MRSAQVVGGLKSFDGFWSAFGGGSESGEAVNDKTALSIAAVYNAVQVIADGVAGAPLEIFEKLGDNGRKLATGRPEYYIVHSAPNEMQTAFVFWHTMLVSALLKGNGYAWIERDGNGFCVALHFYQNDEVGVWKDGRRLWYKFPDMAEMQPASEVYHLKGLSLNGYTGVNPVTYHANTMGNAIAAKKMQGRYYKNGTPAKGWIETPAGLKIEKAREISKFLGDNYAGDQAYKFMVLPEALKFHGITLSQADAQYIEDQKLGVEDIARIFNVPLHKIKSMGAATRANVEQENIAFVTDTLRPWAKRNEQELDMKLFGRQARYFTKHNLDALKRGDTATLTDHIVKMIYSGVYSVNDALALLNRNPVEGGDDRLQPTNTYNIQQIMADLDKKKAETEKLLAEADSSNNTQ